MMSPVCPNFVLSYVSILSVQAAVSGPRHPLQCLNMHALLLCRGCENKHEQKQVSGTVLQGRCGLAKGCPKVYSESLQ